MWGKASVLQGGQGAEGDGEWFEGIGQGQRMQLKKTEGQPRTIQQFYLIGDECIFV